jgi:hypothetical protein
MPTTPWGTATILEEITVPQSAEEREFVTRIQLLEDEEGNVLVRFAYSTSDIARRGPVTLRERDLRRLGRMLPRVPKLGAALGLLAPRKVRDD